ncbi:hypothetical protein ABV900_004559 [Salmonella enterica]
MPLTEFAWLFFLGVLSLLISYVVASILWAKGNVPDCFSPENWSLGTGLVFLFIESWFGFCIYLQASGQMPTLLDFLS